MSDKHDDQRCKHALRQWNSGNYSTIRSEVGGSRMGNGDGNGRTGQWKLLRSKPIRDRQGSAMRKCAREPCQLVHASSNPGHEDQPDCSSESATRHAREARAICHQRTDTSAHRREFEQSLRLTESKSLQFRIDAYNVM